MAAGTTVPYSEPSLTTAASATANKSTGAMSSSDLTFPADPAADNETSKPDAEPDAEQIEEMKRSIRREVQKRFGAGGKELPELYRSSGNEATDRLAFMHMLEQLKLQKRSGWIREGVKEPESVADHMYRMGMLAMLLPINTPGEPPLDIGKCVQLEQEAMQSFLQEMLGGEGCREARERIWALWEEYEARQTPEAKLVKDLDRVELIMQAVEYERSHLHHPAIRAWAEQILKERKALWASRGPELERETDLGDLEVGSAVDAKKA